MKKSGTAICSLLLATVVSIMLISCPAAGSGGGGSDGADGAGDGDSDSDGDSVVISRMLGEWQYEQENGSGQVDERWLLTVTDETSESHIYEYVDGDWAYRFGARGTYEVSGDELSSTFTGGTFDGTTWFGPSDSENWSTFVDLVGATGNTVLCAVSVSGQHMFQYSDVWGAPVIYVRTDGNPVSASSTYPSSMGEWHYITPFGDEKWELTVSETTSESFVYSSVEGGWHLDFGVRSTYVENGDSVEAAFTEATLDGTTWFDASDSGQWDSFVEMAGGSEWSAIWAVSPSGNRMFHDNDTWDAPVMYTRGPAPDPADPSETPLMDTPYLDASDIGAITEAFSVDENAPWGFEHRGIDFFPASQAPGSLTLIRAVESGTVASVVSWVNPGNGNWQVNVEVAYDPVFTIAYTFEPMSPDATIGEAQLAEIAVQSGDAVQKGDTIGNLYYGEDGTHLDFAILRNQHSVCPEPYFTAEARASVLSILQTTWPGASMCYE